MREVTKFSNNLVHRLQQNRSQSIRDVMFIGM